MQEMLKQGIMENEWGEIMKIRVQRSRRKSIAVKVISENELLVKAPIYVSDAEIEEMLVKYQNRISRQINDYKEEQQKKEENVLYYLGKPYTYHVELGKRNQVLIADEITITHTISRSYIEVYESFCKKEAQRIGIDLLNECIMKFPGLVYPELKIKKVKSKWGSCAYMKNEITINSVMVMCPLECFREVMYHELCHFYVHDHSPRFHELLETVCPNHRKIEKELKNYAFLL